MIMVDPSATPKIIKTLNSQMDNPGNPNQDCINNPATCCTRVGGYGRDLDNPPRNTWVGGPTDNQVSPEIEPERALGQYTPVRVMQCCNCASFYLEGEEPEDCPECGSDEVEEFGKVLPTKDAEDRLGRYDSGLDDEDDGMSEEDLDLDLDESLDLLESHKLNEFNRKYGRKARVRGRNFYLISEGIRSRSQRLSREQLRSYKLSKYYNR